MNSLMDIIEKFTSGKGKHARLPESKDKATSNPANTITSRAHTSDTGRTVTARMTPQERRRLRRIRKIRKHRRPARKRTICCQKMERRRTRKGYAWGAICHFKYLSGKKSGSIGASWVTATRGPRKPAAIMKDGKRVRLCRAGQIARLKKRLSS